ncbi:RnfABCDGE type electron transport complex subunit B [Halomonas sp. TRM85114]|uniref:RnfABCDGE type electron transport complex subunit B n=1 Tax=Halomonas jincaotanensis TaxID=2810616 RepID=UPI001BD46320|nr:RnfABCDGE type electron transport complex subunit B [Halomonas jincaotanensis]MBS9402401.1 RnfABCDGE type electron transport complex subunit B [Halomonas jincaotanensis]
MSRHLDLIDAIDAELPQTQCGQCGHPGCRPYAEAIAAGGPINECPPGGEATVVRLATVTGRAVVPLAQPAQSPLLARIREAECIGCTKCIQACPVDAILGAAKRMHTVIEAECTGCELCVAPCPVDCIDILPHPAWEAAESEAERQAYLAERAALGRQRCEARNQRLARQAREKRLERQRRLIRQGSRASRGATDNPFEQRQRRMAVKAAEEAQKRARRQLAHAERQNDEAAMAAARQQETQASHMLDDARAALDALSSSQTTSPSDNP